MAATPAILIGVCPNCGKANQIAGVTDADARADASPISTRRIDVDCDHCHAQFRLHEFVEARRRFEREQRRLKEIELSEKIAAQKRLEAVEETQRSRERAERAEVQRRAHAEQRPAQLNELRRIGRVPREFRVELVSEGWFSVLFLGHASIPTQKMTEVLNRYGADGWDLAFQLIERRRFLIFWTREAAIITFSREQQ